MIWFLTYCCSWLLWTRSLIKIHRCMHSFVSYPSSSWNKQYFQSFFPYPWVLFWRAFYKEFFLWYPSKSSSEFRSNLCRKRISALSPLSLQSFWSYVQFFAFLHPFHILSWMSSNIYDIYFGTLGFCILLAQISLGLAVKIRKIHGGSLSTILKSILHANP